MSFAFFHQGTSAKDAARRKRAYGHRAKTFYCECCEREVCITLRSKFKQETCKHCTGELKYS